MSLTLVFLVAFLPLVAVAVTFFVMSRRVNAAKDAAAALLQKPEETTFYGATGERDEEELARLLATKDAPELPAIDPRYDPLPLTLDRTTLGKYASTYLGKYVQRLTDCAAADASPIGPIMESDDLASAAFEMFNRWTVAASRLPEDAPELQKASHGMMRDLRGAYAQGFDALAWEASETARDIIDTMRNGKPVGYAGELRLVATSAPLWAAQHRGIYTVPKIVRLASLALAQQGTRFVPRPKIDAAPVTTDDAPATTKNRAPRKAKPAPVAVA